MEKSISSVAVSVLHTKWDSEKAKDSTTIVHEKMQKVENEWKYIKQKYYINKMRMENVWNGGCALKTLFPSIFFLLFVLGNLQILV